MRHAAWGDTVLVTYIGRLDDGTIFDQVEEPQEVVIGEGKVNPAFEGALDGMAPGETKSVVLPAKLAYGPYRRRLIFRLKRSELNLPEEPVPGGVARISLKDGKQSLVTIRKVDRRHVVVDANHPLAGKDLTFTITLTAIIGE
ncbi:FKBP-type peptidyl-prolyl cis-trans isomerase [Methanofollis fontis]|uniref:Peptidyl-prolyl cis-trans isomerase n=1 Tax=Methanofollis fontis TaxID=2052832 RepID=A0A483CQW5_9EURY|nr:FKBP-type peptidyl-prolyl cis-trans isomerase [Methanofollis fontis]TAJ43415.1 peptidylprolyl isomerase [Methanofollis fontis]